jgi:hypothetical protein
LVEAAEKSPVLDSLLMAAETDILESTTVNADE